MAEYYRDARDFLGILGSYSAGRGYGYDASFVSWGSSTGHGTTYSSATHITAADPPSQNQTTQFSDSYVNSAGSAPANRITGFASGSYYVWLLVGGGNNVSAAAAHGVTISSEAEAFANSPGAGQAATPTWSQVGSGTYAITGSTSFAFRFTNANGWLYAIRAVCLKTTPGAPSLTPGGNTGDNVVEADGAEYIQGAGTLLIDARQYLSSAAALINASESSYVLGAATLLVEGQEYVSSATNLQSSVQEYLSGVTTLSVLTAEHLAAAAVLAVGTLEYLIGEITLSTEETISYIPAEITLCIGDKQFIRGSVNLDTADQLSYLSAGGMLRVISVECLQGSAALDAADSFTHVSGAITLNPLGVREFMPGSVTLASGNYRSYVSGAVAVSPHKYASFVFGGTSLSAPETQAFIRGNADLKSYQRSFVRGVVELSTLAGLSYVRGASTLLMPGERSHIQGVATLLMPGNREHVSAQVSLYVPPGISYIVGASAVHIRNRGHIGGIANVAIAARGYVKGEAAVQVPVAGVGSLISCDATTKKVYIHSGVSGSIISSFSPYAASGLKPLGLGITASGDMLSSAEGVIYRHAGVSATILYSFNTPTSRTADGLATHLATGNLISGIRTPGLGSYIYVHSGVSAITTGSFLAPDVSGGGATITGVSLDPSGNLVSSVSAGNWWGNQSKISVHDGISASVITSFENAWNSGNLLITDVLVERNGNIIDSEIISGKIRVHSGASSIIAYQFASPGPEPAGLTTELSLREFVAGAVPILADGSGYIAGGARLEPLVSERRSYYRDARDFLGITGAASHTPGQGYGNGYGWDSIDNDSFSTFTGRDTTTYYTATHISTEGDVSPSSTQNLRDHYTDTYLNALDLPPLDRTTGFVEGYYYIYVCVRGYDDPDLGDELEVHKFIISGEEYLVASKAGAWTWRLLSEDPIVLTPSTIVNLRVNNTGSGGVFGLRGIYLTNSILNIPSEIPYGDGGDADRERDKLLSSDIKFYLTVPSAEGGAQSLPDNSLGYWRSGTEVEDGTVHGLFDVVNMVEKESGDDEVRCIAIKNVHPRKKFHGVKVRREAISLSDSSGFSFALEHPRRVASPVGAAQKVASEGTLPLTDSSESSLSGDVTPWFSAQISTLDFGSQHATYENLLPGDTFFIWARRIIQEGESVQAGQQIRFHLEGNYEEIDNTLTITWDVGAEITPGDAKLELALGAPTIFEMRLDLSIQQGPAFVDAFMDLSLSSGLQPNVSYIAQHLGTVRVIHEAPCVNGACALV